MTVGFHSGLAAAIIVGGQIIGTTIQTSTSPPYVELGPTVFGRRGAFSYPGVVFVSANSGRYDNAVPALFYGESGNSKVLVLSGGEAQADGISGAAIDLYSTDDLNSGFPGGAFIGGQSVTLSATGAIRFLSRPVNDWRNNIIPAFEHTSQSLVTAGGGIITVTHSLGTANVEPCMWAISGNFILRLIATTTTTVTFFVYAPGGASPIANGITIPVRGFIASFDG